MNPQETLYTNQGLDFLISNLACYLSSVHYKMMTQPCPQGELDTAAGLFYNVVPISPLNSEQQRTAIFEIFIYPLKTMLHDRFPYYNHFYKRKWMKFWGFIICSRLFWHNLGSRFYLSHPKAYMYIHIYQIWLGFFMAYYQSLWNLHPDFVL